VRDMCIAVSNRKRGWIKKLIGHLTFLILQSQDAVYSACRF